jgi:hypothetical protein
MLPKSILVIAGYILFYYLTFFGPPSFALSFLFALAMGYFAAQIGLSIQHDANHGTPIDLYVLMVLDIVHLSSYASLHFLNLLLHSGAYSNVHWLGYLMSTSLDFVGASRFVLCRFLV